MRLASWAENPTVQCGLTPLWRAVQPIKSNLRYLNHSTFRRKCVQDTTRISHFNNALSWGLVILLLAGCNEPKLSAPGLPAPPGDKPIAAEPVDAHITLPAPRLASRNAYFQRAPGPFMFKHSSCFIFVWVGWGCLGVGMIEFCVPRGWKLN